MCSQCRESSESKKEKWFKKIGKKSKQRRSGAKKKQILLLCISLYQFPAKITSKIKSSQWGKERWKQGLSGAKTDETLKERYHLNFSKVFGSWSKRHVSYMSLTSLKATGIQTHRIFFYFLGGWTKLVFQSLLPFLPHERNLFTYQLKCYHFIVLD